MAETPKQNGAQERVQNPEQEVSFLGGVISTAKTVALWAMFFGLLGLGSFLYFGRSTPDVSASSGAPILLFDEKEIIKRFVDKTVTNAEGDNAQFTSELSALELTIQATLDAIAAETGAVILTTRAAVAGGQDITDIVWTRVDTNE